MNPLSLADALYRWAFPRGAHHQLLLAAIGGNADAARKAARQWLAEHDIDDASFRDQRLLLAVIGRFGQDLSQDPAYPRLVGLQKLLWSRSLLSLQEARPTLQKIGASGHPLLVIKGAARLASEPAARKLRVAWDIDAVVTSQGMRAAFDILVADDWQPSPGTSHQYLRQHLNTIRSINFYKGNYGDIDLHSQAFHPGQGDGRADRELWERSTTAALGGLAVQVPAAEDRIALAIAHGGLDGHTHSDWLVDCAAIMQTGQVDWKALGRILAQRGLEVPASVMFRYFVEELKLEIPPTFLKQLSPRAVWTAPTRVCLGLIQSRPKEQFGPVGQVVRGLAKVIRKRSGARHAAARPAEIRLHIRRLPTLESGETPGGFVRSFELPFDPQVSADGEVDIQLVVDIEPYDGRRRVELEINSADTHLCRISYRRWLNGHGPVRLGISGRVRAAGATLPLKLVSRPSRQLRPGATSEQRQRYGSLAFRVVSCDLRCASQLRAAAAA